MQFTILSVFAALVATSMAIPVPDLNHPATAEVLFLGAANALFPQEFTIDGHYTAISMLPRPLYDNRCMLTIQTTT